MGLNAEELRIGGKSHFEEESGSDYMGTREINKITKDVLNELLPIESDSCAPNAKILLIREDGAIKMAHYEEKSKPGMGEELHATLLYTKPRGFCDSETLEQIRDHLFEQDERPLTIERVAKAYSAIIKPEQRFTISEVILTKSESGPTFIIAELLFDGRKNIYKGNKPISAGLHMALVNCNDSSLLASETISDPLIQSLNKALKDKMIKVATQHGVADLEFGISGSSLRMRAGELKQF